MPADTIDDTPIWEDPENGLSYVQYSQRSYAFYCTAEWHAKRREFLKHHGRFNKNLINGPGWVISMKNHPVFLAALGDGPLPEPPELGTEAAAPARAKAKAKPKARVRVRVQAPPPAEIDADSVQGKVDAIGELMASLLVDVTAEGQRVEIGGKQLVIGTSSAVVSDMAEDRRGKRLALWLESETGALAVLE